VLEIDVLKIARRNARGIADGVAQRGPPELERAVGNRRERPASEPRDSHVDRAGLEAAEVTGHEARFLELGGFSGDVCAGFGKTGKGRSARERAGFCGRVPEFRRLRRGGRWRAFDAQPEGELLLLAQGLRFEAHVAQGLGKIGGETVQGIDPFRRDTADHFKQLGKIRMVAQGERGVALVAVAAVLVRRPAGENGCAGGAEIAQHCGVHDRRRAKEHLAAHGFGAISLELREPGAKLLINFHRFVNGLVQHQGKAGFAQRAEDLLALAERVAQEHGGLLLVQGFPAKPDDALENLRCGRKNVMRPAEGGFHDQVIGGAGFAWFGREAGP